MAYSNHFLLTKTLKQWEKDNISFSVHDITVFETSVFVHLHENDKWAIKPAPKTPFSCGRTAKTEKRISIFKSIRIVFYWPIKIEINAERHFRIKIREIVKRDLWKWGCVFPEYFPALDKRPFLVYPSPKPTFCPKWEVSVNIGLGKG